MRDLVGTVLRGKNIGIVGLGRIGSELARMLSVFRPKTIYYWNRSRKPELEHALDIKYLALDILFQVSHIIIVSIALTPDTEKLINRKLIGLMRPDTIIINISRGRVIDEEALIEALKKERIGGAALDVYWDEPLSRNNPLLNLKNVVLTPHIGGFSDYSSYYTALDVYRILEDIYINNNIPYVNLVNKEVIGK